MMSQAARQIVETIGMTMRSMLDPVMSMLPFRAHGRQFVLAALYEEVKLAGGSLASVK